MSRAPRPALLALQAVLIALVTWGLFRSVGLGLAELRRADLAAFRPDARLLLLSTSMLLLVYGSHAFLWRRILGDLAGVRPTAPQTVRVYFVAGLGRYIPGRLWQVAGIALLARQEGLPPMSATAASVLGQIGFSATGLVLLALLLPGWAGLAPALIVAAAAAGMAGALLLVFRSAAGSGVRAWLRRRLGERADALVLLSRRVRLAEALLWVLGYAASWALLCGAFVLLVGAFDARAMAEPAHLAGTLAASYLGGYVAIFAPAGIGVREGVMGVLLAQVMPLPAALVVSVSSRLWFTAGELLPLLTLPLLDRRAGEPRSYPLGAP